MLTLPLICQLIRAGCTPGDIERVRREAFEERGMMTTFNMYCPECKEFSVLSRPAFTLWPGLDTIECPRCHVSYTVKVEFSKVISAGELNQKRTKESGVK